MGKKLLVGKVLANKWVEDNLAEVVGKPFLSF